MIVKKSEILIFLKQAASITEADACLLDLIHPLAEAALQDWLGHDVEYQQHTEFFPLGQPQRSTEYPLEDAEFRTGGTVQIRANRQGVGTEFLQLKHTPVVPDGLEVYEDPGGMAGQESGSFDNTETQLTAGVDFFLDIDDQANQISRTGILYRIGAWPVEPRSVKVVYYGGFTSAQLAGRFGGAVKLAAMQTIAAAFWNAKQIATSKGMGPYTSETIGKWSASYGQSPLANMTFAVPMEVQWNLFGKKNLGRIFG